MGRVVSDEVASQHRAPQLVSCCGYFYRMDFGLTFNVTQYVHMYVHMCVSFLQC